MTNFVTVVVVAIGYLVGSLCSAVIISKVFELPDPRQDGSKNPGATNVLRLAGKKYATIVLILDVLKGVLPVLLAKMLGATPFAISATAFAAVLGHAYPAFFQFRGGKGVATALGALFALHTFLGMLVVATWLIVAVLTRYSSLASMISIGLAPIYSLLSINRGDVLTPISLITLLVIFKHRGNITRLMDKTEPKIKFKNR